MSQHMRGTVNTSGKLTRHGSYTRAIVRPIIVWPSPLIENPMSTLNMALLSRMLTVAHIKSIPNGASGCCYHVCITLKLLDSDDRERILGVFRHALDLAGELDT